MTVLLSVIMTSVHAMDIRSLLNPVEQVETGELNNLENNKNKRKEISLVNENAFCIKCTACKQVIHCVKKKRVLKNNFLRHLFNHMKKQGAVCQLYKQLFESEECQACGQELHRDTQDAFETAIRSHIFEKHSQVTEAPLRALCNNQEYLSFFGDNCMPWTDFEANSPEVDEQESGEITVQELYNLGLIKPKRHKNDQQNGIEHAILCPKCKKYICAAGDEFRLRFSFRDHLFYHATKKGGAYNDLYTSIQKTRSCKADNCQVTFENGTANKIIRKHILGCHVAEDDVHEIFTCGKLSCDQYFDANKKIGSLSSH